MKAKMKARRDPLPGTVVSIPLPDCTYCFGCQLAGPYIRMFRFRTTTPRAAIEEFITKRWGPTIVVADLPPEISDVCRIPLSDEEMHYRPDFYEELKGYARDRFGYPYRITDPVTKEYRYVEADGICGRQKLEWLVGRRIIEELSRRKEEFELRFHEVAERVGTISSTKVDRNQVSEQL